MDGRASSFMPAIKCSQCGLDVEISMMGDHICGGPPPEPEPVPAMPPMDRLDAFSATQGQPDKFGRVPPRVDTSAANRGYNSQPQLTPVSASTGSRSISPKTPNGRTGTGAMGNDYFSPAIMGSTPPPQSRRPGGYGGFEEPEPYEVEPVYAPVESPKKQGSGLLSRMNTIAPGPFDAGRRSNSSSRNMFSSRDERGSFGDNASDSARSFGANDRPGTGASYGSSSGIAPPRFPRKNGYGGFGPPQREDDFEAAPFDAAKRSDTFPKQTPNGQADAPARTPSAPTFRSDRSRRPTNENTERPVMTGERRSRPSFGMGPDTSRQPPPRTSLTRPPTRGQVASINLTDEFGAGNPYHSPTVSQSSTNSGYSEMTGPSQPSSNSSPSRSMKSRRTPSDTSNFDGLMKDLESSMSELQPRELPSAAPMQPPPKDNSGSLQSEGRRPAPENMSFDRDDPAVQGPPSQNRKVSPPSPDFLKPEPRRADPAVQTGPRTHSRRPSQDPAIQGLSRKTCKACGLTIQGKSISSADGRLTGRYHKACFVCTTCSEPFTSSTFYVMNDRPYCEHHYHKLNGSLCGSCNIGIEGQYLEDESYVKYHTGCFRCEDCGDSLSDGYFEGNGMAYCERDAWKRVQRSPRPSMREPSLGPSRPPGAFGARPGPNMGGKMGPRGGYGLPTGGRMGPPMGLAPPRGIPKMEKRMTRMGMM